MSTQAAGRVMEMMVTGTPYRVERETTTKRKTYLIRLLASKRCDWDELYNALLGNQGVGKVPEETWTDESSYSRKDEVTFPA